MSNTVVGCGLGQSSSWSCCSFDRLILTDDLILKAGVRADLLGRRGVESAGSRNRAYILYLSRHELYYCILYIRSAVRTSSPKETSLLLY